MKQPLPPDRPITLSGVREALTSCHVRNELTIVTDGGPRLVFTFWPGADEPPVCFCGESEAEVLADMIHNVTA